MATIIHLTSGTQLEIVEDFNTVTEVLFDGAPVLTAHGQADGRRVDIRVPHITHWHEAPRHGPEDYRIEVLDTE